MFVEVVTVVLFFFFQAEDGIRDLVRSRGLGDVYKRQTLGRIEAIRAGEADSLVNGLLRAAGKPSLEDGTGDVSFAPALSVGDTWLLTVLWKELGFADAFRRVLRNRRQFDTERLLRVMVFNRLCDPESKLGILRLSLIHI